MSLPEPAFPLDNSCSTLFNNTLYSYTSDAFQSLSISKGAEWAELPSGISVKGAVCVKSTPANNTQAAALYVVGGVAANSSDYQGLQRFTFSEGQWETLAPTTAVTQNRLYHNAVYLNASNSILVYAGTQDGTKQASSQTFTISAAEPYQVLAYESLAPPAIYPILLPWSESKALFVGGSDTNTKAMLFSAASAWKDSNATLAAPIYNSTNIKAIVLNGDDSSKTLYTFDMTVSPNSVNRTILVDADGNPVQGATAITPTNSGEQSSTAGEKRRSAEKARRGTLTVQNWPAYNDTLAPTSIRTSYSVAQDQSGMVVISGGNASDVLCIFKARDNSWVNATAQLVDSSTPAQQGLWINPSPTSSILSTPTSSPTAAAAPTHANDSGPPFPVKILGAVLGSIVGIALICLLVLFFLRWRRRRRNFNNAGHQRRASGLDDEKDAMDFMDRGLPPMSSARQVGHQPANSAGSFSSMAILMGRVGGHKRGGEKGEGSIASDSSSQFNKNFNKTAIGNPMPMEPPMTSLPALPKEPMLPPLDTSRPPLTKARGMNKLRGSARRSSGWNRYWSGASSMNILGFGSGSRRNTYEEGSERDSGSAYSDHGQSQFTQNSALPPPLKVPYPGGAELSRVATGSPTVSHYTDKYPLTRELTGTIERTGSMSSVSSYASTRMDAFSSGVPASVHEGEATYQPDPPPQTNYGRAPSAAFSTHTKYTESTYAQASPRDTAQFPRDTQFPAPPARLQPPKASSDMSWLNLGNGKM